MNLREIARLILSESVIPLTAREVWDIAVSRGLDKLSGTHGKTPDATLCAYLYTSAQKPGSGIVAEGKKPVRFRFNGSLKSLPPASVKRKPVAKSAESSLPNPPNSKFIGPCLEVLLAKSPAPMTVAEIQKGILSLHPELPWKSSGGAIRAALLRAAKSGAEIRQVAGVLPPKFFVGETEKEASAEQPNPKAGKSAQQAQKESSFSFLECAGKVLREFGAKLPMHYREITKRAIEQGWLVSSGERPEATMNALIGSDIRKRRAGGKPQVFVQHGKGFIGLAEWMSKGIRFQANEHNKAVRAKMLKRLHVISPTDFENLIRTLLEAMDFIDTTVTPASGDGGIDVRGTWRVADGIEIRMAIQAKRWKANVQAPVVQAVRGSLTGSERGMIITTSDFSKGAREEAADSRKSSTVSLINGEQLVNLLVKYEVGVRSDTISILEPDPDSEWFSAKG